MKSSEQMWGTGRPSHPYEKLKSLPEAARWLKAGVTFERLDAVAYTHSDLDAALAVNAARDELFRALWRAWGCAA